MTRVETAIAFARAHAKDALKGLEELLRIPSVSTLPEHKADMDKAAEWLAARLRSLGMTQVEILSTKGHAAVCGERITAKDKPTVLVYGHYDVQPADPLDEWRTPPFEPTVVGDNLIARGASDMKGQIMAQLAAVEALLETGGLPVNLKYVLEGEEEIGSPNMGGLLKAHQDRFTCDAALNCDAGIHAPDLPGIVYGLRGLAYFEIEVRGPATDLHSGLFGGIVHNPAQVLCELIAAMHDSDGRITLPGFYDSVESLTDEERAVIAQCPTSEADWRRMSGVPALWDGEKGYTAAERIGARPTLEVNGFLSGFTGQGSKTVLPARAVAKVSMRLVPNQEADAVAGQLREYVKRHAPDTVTCEVREVIHGPTAIMNRDTPYMRAAAKALTDTFGVEPVFKREGGSVPIVALLQQELGVDPVMLGFALPDDGVHGPNEKQHLPTFYKGIETYIRFLCEAGGIAGARGKR